MATKPKPQPVTIRENNGSAYIKNEKQTKIVRLYDVKLYNASGVVASISEYELVRRMDRGANIVLSIPMVWNSRKEPDYTEQRAHIVGDYPYYAFNERRYTLYIPIEAVTVEAVEDIASKGTGYTERYYTVAEFPAKFSKWYRHPFDRHAARAAAEQLVKDGYDILDADTINTPHAQKYLAEFWQQIQDFAAEAARTKAESSADYIAECLEAANA